MTIPKYIIFKYEDWRKWRMGMSINPIPSVDDAVVIRRQDVFAPPLLTLYAQNVITVIEMLKSIYPESEELDTQVERLLETADYFQEQAELAWGTNRKLPD